MSGSKRKRADGSPRAGWILDYRDSAGIRRWLSFKSREAAEHRLADVLKQQKHREPSAVNPDITCSDYVQHHWLPSVKASGKRRTHEVYESVWRMHLAPTIGTKKLRTIEATQIRKLLSAKLMTSARQSVRLMMAVARACFSQAVEDRILQTNPGTGHGRRLRLIEKKDVRAERIKAMTGEQLTQFLAAAQSEPKYADLFALLARTGMRVGEGLGLQWPDLDLDHSQARIERTFSKRRYDTPKAHAARSVDLSPELVTRLRHRLVAAERTDGHVFTTNSGGPMDESKTRKAMLRICAAAKLPPFTPHDLRHSYASIHLQSGTPVTYVQRQLGHASIQQTVDTYGKWLASTNLDHAAKLDKLAPMKLHLRVVDGR